MESGGFKHPLRALYNVCYTDPGHPETYFDSRLRLILVTFHFRSIQSCGESVAFYQTLSSRLRTASRGTVSKLWSVCSVTSFQPHYQRGHTALTHEMFCVAPNIYKFCVARGWRMKPSPMCCLRSFKGPLRCRLHLPAARCLKGLAAVASHLNPVWTPFGPRRKGRDRARM